MSNFLDIRVSRAPAPQRQVSSLDDDIMRKIAESALRRSNVSRCWLEDIERLLQIGILDTAHRDYRQSGTLLTPAEVKALGCRANAKLSREFVDSLNDAGRDNPIEAAELILRLFLGAVSGTRQLWRTAEMFGNDVRIRVHPNSMAAGPCTACTALAATPVPLAFAPIWPLPECPHPDQCVLHWRFDPRSLGD